MRRRVHRLIVATVLAGALVVGLPHAPPVGADTTPTTYFRLAGEAGNDAAVDRVEATAVSATSPTSSSVDVVAASADGSWRLSVELPGSPPPAITLGGTLEARIRLTRPGEASPVCDASPSYARFDQLAVGAGGVVEQLLVRVSIPCGGLRAKIGGVVAIGASSAFSDRVAPQQVDFGRVETYRSASVRTVTISNDGAAPLAIDTVRLEADPFIHSFRLLSQDCRGRSLATGETCRVRLVGLWASPSQGPLNQSWLEIDDDETVGPADFRVRLLLGPAPSTGGLRPIPFVGGPTRQPADAVPLVGDWDLDGRDIDVIWYGAGAKSDAQWLVEDGKRIVASSPTINETGTALVGLFNGDDYLDILFYGIGSRPDALWYGAAGATFRRVPLTVSGVYLPITGDFDGNGLTDVLWFSPLVPDQVWYVQPNGSFRRQLVTQQGLFSGMYPADYTGDGRTDILWWRWKASRHPLWVATATGFRVTSVPSPNPETSPVPGDYDGDRRVDISWSGPGPRPDATAYSAAGFGQFFPRYVSGYYTPLPLNLNGDKDRRDDLLLWASNPISSPYWLSQGRSWAPVTGQRVPTEGWAIWGALDNARGNDSDDLLWASPAGTFTTLAADGDGPQWIFDGETTPLRSADRSGAIPVSSLTGGAAQLTG